MGPWQGEDTGLTCTELLDESDVEKLLAYQKDLYSLATAAGGMMMMRVSSITTM